MASAKSELWLWVTSGFAVVVAVGYAVAPPADPVQPMEAPAGTGPSGDQSVGDAPHASLDRGVFNVDLWIDPPPPPPPPAPTPTETRAAKPVEPPPTLDLIAITQSGGDYAAVLYEKREDELRTVTAGDSIGPYTVTAIGPVTVHFEHRGRTVTLGLDQPRIAAGTREGDDG